MSTPSKHFVCIMAGGSGERFWPMSRKQKPKHLLNLFSEATLLEETVRRAAAAVPMENVFVLTNETQLEGVRQAVPFLKPEQVIGEPAKRDTAPAATLATALARAKNPEAVVALLPADSLIKNKEMFAQQLKEALAWAEGSEALLTFSIPPSYPATGFGYLQIGKELARGAQGSAFYQVDRFVEKPDSAKAEEYVSGGKFGWNAGMFIWKVSSYLREAERLAPELAAFLKDFRAEDPSFLKERFVQLPKISVDYAILEKAQAVVAVKAQFDWDDVGLWTALPSHLPPDSSGNTIRGQVVTVDSTNNIVFSNGRMIALCGVKDLVVVETADGILVCHRDSVQKIKEIQPHLPEELL